MEFRVLGQLEVVDDGRTIALGSHKQRALLALLVMHHGHVVSTDRIIDELWGEDAGPDRQNALWVHVSNLRSALEPDRERRSEGTVVRTRAPGYVLGVDREQVDAFRFERLLSDGRSQLAEHPESAARTLRTALGLWHGRPYEEFSYEAFAQHEIARLDELRLEALETRIAADLARGLDDELVSELEALAREHRLRERLTAQLMLALYRSGRQAEALRAYQALHASLRHEVGADPSSELQELERRILAGDPTLSLPTGERSGASTGAAIRGYEIRDEIGRTDLTVVHRAFQPSVGREVAITTLLPDIADDPTFIRRFEGEASLVAALEHSHIVPLYDYWREPGAAYLVTRFMRGGSLADIVETSALSPDDAVRMISEVAGALDAAHRHGIVHGDLRAETVLFDDDRSAHVSGFGIGRHGSSTTGSDASDPTTDVRALADIAAQAMTGMPGTFEQLEGALPADVADALRPPATGAPFSAAELAAALLTATGGHRPLIAERGRPVENPYRGLSAFGVRDEAVFHGRQRIIDRLVSRLGMGGPPGRFVAIVGPSGSGKSSVVRAGLLPALAGDAVPGSSEWFMTGLTPGAHPFESLEDALLKVAVDPPATLLEQLATGESGLRRAARRVLPDDRSQLLIVVDQFEEVFTLADPDVADAFLDGLAGAVADDRSRVRVVITLRADFYDGPLRHRAFGELLREGTEVITPLSTEELDEAITRPAAAVGVEFSPALVAEMVNEVVGRPGALPLLQYALTELFDQRSGHVIDTNLYHQIGGVSGALAARAEELYAAGDADERLATREVFLRLVTLGEGAHDTRRRALVSELEDLPLGRGAIASVIERYSRFRLLTMDRDPVTRGPTVEISHEALLTEWHRLEGWISSTREDLRNQRRLSALMAEWRTAGEPDDHLITGGRLARLEAWASDTDIRIGRKESEFLERSIAARNRSAREAASREAERDAAERRATRRLRFGALAAVFAALVGGLAVVAILQRRSAQESEQSLAQALRAQELASASVLELGRDPALATRLALASAFATSDSDVVTPESLDALHWAIQESNLVYPADRTTPIAVRPGPRGPTGVFALPVEQVIELAQSSEPGRFSVEQCATYFGDRACPDPGREIVDTLTIQGGDDSYGVVPPGPGALDGTGIELLSAFGPGDESFTAELDRFQSETGIIMSHPAVEVPEFELDRRRIHQEPDPDVVFLPQPARLPEQETGSLIDLSTYLDVEQLRSDVGSQLMALSTVGTAGEWPSDRGALYGLPTAVDVKGLVFYPRAKFEAAGYEVPQTFDELTALSDRIVADGRTPWCHHFESGLASGWPGTDLLETLIIREGGAELYDSWRDHEIPFDDPAIVSAGAKAEELLMTPGYARGGSNTISQLSVAEGLTPLLGSEPRCWLYHQASFMLSGMPADAAIGVDIDVFPFPPMSVEDPVVVTGGGNVLSVLADRPEVRLFAEHAASPAWGETWAASNIGFLSPNVRFDAEAYGAETDADRASTQRLMGDIVRQAIEADTWRFDASDLMPAEVGSGAAETGRGAFLQGVLDVVDGRRTMSEALTDIELAWQELEAASE